MIVKTSGAAETQVRMDERACGKVGGVDSDGEQGNGSTLQ
jgi:hypothetical protein